MKNDDTDKTFTLFYFIVWLSGAYFAVIALFRLLEITKASQAYINESDAYIYKWSFLGLLAGSIALKAFLLLSARDHVQFFSPVTERKAAFLCYIPYALFMVYMAVFALIT